MTVSFHIESKKIHEYVSLFIDETFEYVSLFIDTTGVLFLSEAVV